MTKDDYLQIDRDIRAAIKQDKPYNAILKMLKVFDQYPKEFADAIGIARGSLESGFDAYLDAFETNVKEAFVLIDMFPESEHWTGKSVAELRDECKRQLRLEEIARKTWEERQGGKSKVKMTEHLAVVRELETLRNKEKRAKPTRIESNLESAGNFTVDPEFRSLLPKLSANEIKRLEGDIASNGCRDKLIVWKEKSILIDGHNRYDICTKYGYPFETMPMSFESRDAVERWMISNQLSRRNISDAKRTLLHLMLKDSWRRKAQTNQAAAGGDKKSRAAKSLPQKSAKAIPPVDTRAEIAKAAGVSHDTVSKVEAVMKKGDESTKEKMLAGDISINKAHKLATGKTAKPVPEVTFESKLEKLMATITKQLQELAKDKTANPKLIAQKLRALAKDFDQ